MLHKPCCKSVAATLILCPVLLLAACAATGPTSTMGTTGMTNTTSVLVSPGQLSAEQARELLRHAAQTDFGCDDPKTVVVSYERIELTCAKGVASGARSYRIAAKPALSIKRDNDLFTPLTCVAVGSTNDALGFHSCLFVWRGGAAETTARNFVSAWNALANSVDPEREAAFEHAARTYRDSPVKPQLPEDAVRLKVQAELAVAQSRFADAAELYKQALHIAPWWPAGHYNRGLILGELQDYQGGIRALQKYLLLEPAAANARAVQLKIYQWESLASGSLR